MIKIKKFGFSDVSNTTIRIRSITLNDLPQYKKWFSEYYDEASDNPLVDQKLDKLISAHLAASAVFIIDNYNNPLGEITLYKDTTIKIDDVTYLKPIYSMAVILHTYNTVPDKSEIIQLFLDLLKSNNIKTVYANIDEKNTIEKYDYIANGFKVLASEQIASTLDSYFIKHGKENFYHTGTIVIKSIL